jgi:hypothetical protein
MVTKSYDGTSSLGAALADLYNFSPKNQTKIAQKIKEGREAVGTNIISEKKKARHLTADEKIAVFNWHSQKVYGYTDQSGIYHHPDGTTEKCLEYGQVLYINTDGSGGLDSEFGRVEFLSPTELPDDLIEADNDKPNFELDKFKRIAFYTRENNERIRKVIALEFYYLEPLTVAAAMNNKSVPEWLEEVTDGWEETKTTTSLTRFVKHAIYQNQK